MEKNSFLNRELCRKRISMMKGRQDDKSSIIKKSCRALYLFVKKEVSFFSHQLQLYLVFYLRTHINTFDTGLKSDSVSMNDKKILKNHSCMKKKSSFNIIKYSQKKYHHDITVAYPHLVWNTFFFSVLRRVLKNWIFILSQCR